MVENYRTLYAQTVDHKDPRHVGGFGVFRHYSQPFTPANTDVITPNNDTPYSWAWLDLRAEPWVVSVPATERYHLLPFHDLDTTYVGYLGSRSTGGRPGHHLIAGPGWTGETPAGIDRVLRADTQLVGCLGRTYLAGPGDVDALRAQQRQYLMLPLSRFAGTPPPPPAPHTAWPVWQERVSTGIEFFALLDFLLGFFPVLPDHRELRARLAALGVGTGTGGFDPAALSPEARRALEQGIADGRARLTQAMAVSRGNKGLFGTRAELGNDDLARGVGAAKGLYGLPQDEAWYGTWQADSTGNHPPNGRDHDYLVRFAPGQLPPAEHFWSVTMYRLPERLLVDNPVGRYSIGDRTPGLIRDPDGGLTLCLQHEEPGEAKMRANWLPAPEGPFVAVVRAYGADLSMTDGRWTLPEMVATSRVSRAN
ncbi:DUF1254 domain-containing protein [Streptomyces sp. NPDC055006]